MKNVSIYIHIPFCVRKCFYCDFLSFPVSADITEYSYVNLLRQEIIKSAPSYKEYRALSIFFGGGTPSLLPSGEVSRIMGTIRNHYHVAEDAEITIEMNPDTVTEDKLREYITAGINRISIGLQSADDDELARIGRIHDYRTFENAYGLARTIGFHNINIDLMAALPEQSVTSYEQTLKKVAALVPEHISAYSLTLEEGTPLYEQRDRYRFPTEDQDREMYWLTGEYLASCGYHRYEISNYARNGCECRHNKVYWQRGNYVGFGLGASSMVENVRWTNPTDMKQYQDYVENLLTSEGISNDMDHVDEKAVSGQLVDAEVSARHVLSLHEQMEEYMFLGLRMMCGVSEQEFSDIFGAQIETMYGETIEKLCTQGVLMRDKGHIRLTERGIDVSNYVMAQFLL